MKTENNSFIQFINDTAGLIFDDSNHPEYPIKYFNLIDGEGLEADDEKSYYGYVYQGIVQLNTAGRGPIILMDGMYFSLNGWFDIENQSLTSKVVVIEVDHNKGSYKSTNFSAMFHVGGPIEPQGRLKYIDGCSDSLLISPVKMGNPCFNHLHFPKDIEQTPHTHPTHRIGIVASGNGKCVTPFGNLPLTKGMIFVIKEWDGVTFGIGLDGNEYPIGTHCFFTSDEEMDVIAFHPDSDFGPTDFDHPMINRTIVNGVPAKFLDDIRTK
jgi:hypothetical protein